MGTCTITVISQFPTKIYHINHLVRPVNKEELFNLRHAQAQNVVEHIFGVLKHWFCILLIGPEYNPKIQARIVSALCTIHNFICIYNPKEGELVETQNPEHANRGSNAGDEVVTQLEGFDGMEPEDIV
jgi:DDE superfamily endonuclease